MAEYYSKLPAYPELSEAQQAAVNDTKAIALAGGPGTGKSIVSLFRHIINHNKENKIESQLLTYTTSLALYLRICCETESKNAAKFVDSSYHWKTHLASKRDEIIHDEAQDLPLIFNKSLNNFSKTISYGADNQQLITAWARKTDGSYNLERCSPEEELKKEFASNSFHILDSNYRNSRRILRLAKKLLIHAEILQELVESCKEEGEFPRLLISNGNPDKQNNAILEIIRSFHPNDAINIGVLLPFNKNVDTFYSLLKTNFPDCTYFYNNEEKFPKGIQRLSNLHITTFKSSKGLEFDVVILPNFHFYNTTFDVVNWRDFYVGVTRTKSNLFLISNSRYALF